MLDQIGIVLAKKSARYTLMVAITTPSSEARVAGEAILSNGNSLTHSGENSNFLWGFIPALAASIISFI